MLQTVTVTSPQPAEPEFLLSEFAIGNVGIVTHSPHGTNIGDPVVRSGNATAVFLKSRTWTDSPSNYRVRPLRKGEAVTITGA